MAEESIVLENVKVDDRGRLTGKVKQGLEESTAFTKLFQRIQNHFNDDQMVAIVAHNVKQNDICVAKSSRDKKWHRVRVESILSSGHGYQACCFMVDEGLNEMIPLPFIRQIPPTFLEVPFQLKKLYLHGVTPITLAMSLEDLNTSMQPCQRWDSAAVEYIKKNIELTHRYRAVVLEEKQDGSLGIRLYLTVGGTQFCLNERLVQQNYATFMTEDDGEDLMDQLPVAARPKRTIADALKSKKISLKEQAPSNSEDQHYVSEPELKSGHGPLSSGSDPERGYTTDSLVIPHRHRQARVTHSPQKYHSETLSSHKSAEKIVSPRSNIEHFSESQTNLGSFHTENVVPRRKGIFDKLEAQLEASIKSTSGRSSPVSDIQESYPARERHSFKGSQSSLARLQISTTIVTSYHQTGSDSDSSDNSQGAKYSTSKFKPVSQLSTRHSDHSSGGQSNKSKSQTESQLLLCNVEDSYQSPGAQSYKSNFQTVSQKSPQIVPYATSQTGSKSSTPDIMKGYQSDTTHVYTRPISSITQTSSPHMCSDTENDRLVPYNRLDSAKLKLKDQKISQLTLQQNNSPQGLKSDSSDSILPSPMVAYLKDYSASNSSLSDSGSVGRGRGIISSIMGRGIASPSRGQGDSSPGSGRGYESPGSGRGNVSPNRGRGVATLFASQSSESPVRGRGAVSPARGRGSPGSPSPVGRGITLNYSPTQPGSSRISEASVSKTKGDELSDKELPESPVPLVKSHALMENSGRQYFQDKNNVDERFSDSGSVSSDKGSMSVPSKKTGSKSVLDKITNVCSNTHVPYTSDADMSEPPVAIGNMQRGHESDVNRHKAVSAISNSSHINMQDNPTEIHRSGKKLNTQNNLRDQNKLMSDSEGCFEPQEHGRMPKQTSYASETESDYFRRRRPRKSDESGTDTDSMSLVERSATGQQVFTKARLPKKFAGKEKDGMSLLEKSAKGQQLYTKARVPREFPGTDNEKLAMGKQVFTEARMPKETSEIERETMSLQAKSATRQQVNAKSRQPRESSGTDTDSTSLLAKSATGQDVFTKARLPKEASQCMRKTPEKSPRTLPPEAQHDPVVEVYSRQPQQRKPMLDTGSELDRPLKSMAVSETGDAAGNLEDQKKKLVAKFTGERLMKTIKKGNKKTSSHEKQERGMFGVENNVLVHGNNAKKPIYKFSETGFAEIVSQHWIREQHPSPQIVQAYAWPAIRGGNHVVAISPPRSGKTLAYLCPLITSLTDQRLYKEIATGNGPYLLILTSSWRKADAVFHETQLMLGGRRDLRLLLLYGGGQEENKGCQLINGCEILIVTPPSLKRVMDAGYTDLQRLCHLVIDDAEEIMENFGEEIKFIMQEYTEVISNQRLRSEVPRQLLLFGTQWTGRIHSFMNRYPVEPLLIITSAFEASIYGKVRQITHMCQEDGRTREIIGILENLAENSRTIIFASKKQDVVNLHNIMKHYCHHCHAVYEDMEMFQISYVAEEWRQHNVDLLVCSDDYITEMKIHDASTIINFDLPSSKTKFCNRLACLRKYFWNFASDEEQTVQPISHLMIKPGVLTSQAIQILQLLKRSSCHIPQELKALIAGAKMGKEEDDDKFLCNQLLAFGFCRNQWKCCSRHIVFPELDHRDEFNWLPDEGEVQVWVTNVVKATHYYVRMISLRHSGGKEDLGTVYSKLQMDLGLWYGNLANLTRQKCPYEGEICGYQDRENFYRVQILEIKDMNCKGAMNTDVTVKYVDVGKEDIVPMHKLYELPAHLKEVPFQAVEVFVCRVKPIDRDTEWTHKADRFISTLLHDKIVEGKIVLRLGNILWLDPLVERQNLGETRTIINKAYVHRELITNGFADDNPNHLEKLYKLCEDKVKISKALIKKAKLDCKLESDVLPECKQYHSVVVSSVSRPDLYFIQRKEKLDELEQLMENLNSMMTKQDPVEDVGVEVKVGDFCLAQYISYDNRWYRGRVTKLEEGDCEVFFADYGDRDTVPKDKVRKIPNDDKLTDFPLQGIECKLADIQPTDCEWEERAGDVMWDLTHFVNNDMKTFTARVTSKDSSSFSGRQRYVVELYDTTGPQDFNLAQELVHQRLAKPSEGCNLTEFPSPSKLRMLIVKTPLQDIPDLCSALYWEKTEAGALKIAGEIQSKLADALSSRQGELEDGVLRSAIQSVVKLVGRVGYSDVNRLILYAVLILARAGERLNRELLNEDCDQQIIRSLELNSNTEVQSDTAEVLAILLQTSKSWLSCFEDLKYVEVLYDLFSSTDSQQIKGYVCQCFSVLCSSQGVLSYIMKKSICSAVTKLLTQSDDHYVIESAILFLLALAHQNSGHPDLEREVLLQVVILTLKKANCEKCIHHCVQFCSNYGSQKRKHKTVLLELEMVPCLSRILQSDLSDKTRQICKDLNDSLAIKVPTQKLSGVHTRSAEETRKERVVAPDIHWAQNSFNVIMSVKVKGATNSSDLVKIQDNLISFRSVVDGVCFAFTYKLFDKVMTDHSRIRVRSSEVQISMKKVEQGRWPRLLHQKQKPANLSIDFERFVDSSDSEYNDEEEPFLLKRKKKTKAFKNAPETKTGTVEPLDDSETDTTDSLENMDDPDRDRYSVFD